MSLPGDCLASQVNAEDDDDGLKYNMCDKPVKH